ncbi:PKD domain containing protein [Fibrisoma limi BUZ 3]|uniref:PKD domain containing protein n=2 Tax=Fibrisoma limi TaxID=663275 RepID=I2GGG8_9BACT|nr:PKD domain containing protein [Fibrisoma limi BUZ 3]
MNYRINRLSNKDMRFYLLPNVFRMLFSRPGFILPVHPPILSFHMLFVVLLRRIMRPLIGCLLLGCSFPAVAQLVELDACSGNLERCITEADTLYEMCFNVKPAPTCAFKKFEMDWDDGKIETFNQAGPLQIKHVYDLRSFIKNCGNGSNKVYKLFIVTDCPGDNKGVQLTFKLKPRADFKVPDACRSQAVYFQNQSCPITNDTEFAWDFGDGTNSTNVSPSHTFPTTQSNYTVKLTATNSCGTSTKSVSVPIKSTPVASYTTSGYTLFNQDTVVCLPNGGTLTLDGTVSLDESRYRWTISPSSYKFIQNTSSSSPITKVQFTETGEYTITLTALNDCGTSAPLICKHRVEDLPEVKLATQPDACEPISYSLTTPTPGATYTFNGQPLAAGTSVNAPVSTAPYIVRGELNSRCGRRTVADTFYVQAPQAVQITAPGRTTAVCVGSARFPVQVNLPGGTWEGTGKAYIETQGNNVFFNPRTAGQYNLIYLRGTSACQRADTIRIAVEGGQVSVQNIAACDRVPFVKLQGSPAGGTWRSTAFPNAIRNDTLFMQGVTGDIVGLTYEYNFGQSGCPARANATVSIGRPRAEFTVSGVCSGSAVQIQNNSSGSSTFQWTLNGQNISTERVPALSLPSGTNRLLLTVGTAGCVDTTSRVLRIVAAPTPVTFTPSQTTGCSPMTVTFAVAGTASPDVQYSWNYGNGTSSQTFQATSQTYRNQTRQAQTYRVVLTASNSCGVQSYTTTLTTRPLVLAEIGVDSTTFRCSPARIRFSNRSTGQTQPATWLWDDGTSPLSSTADTLSHLFSARDSTRTFRVQLIAAGECGRDSDNVAIRVSPSQVKALMTLNKPEACPGEPIAFRDATTPKPDRVIWRFSDGTVSTDPNPQHSFPQPNTTYTISLTALTACGYDSTRRTIRTTQPPAGDFRTGAPFTCTEQAIRFTSLANPANRFRWDFGDGSALDSVNVSPIHTYQAMGNKTVTLTVFGSSAACKTEIKKQVEVRAKPKASFTVEGGQELCAPATVRLVSTTTDANQWQWYISDGRTLAGSTVEVPLMPGQFDVSLVASFNGVCRDSVGQRSVLRGISCAVHAPDAFTPNKDGIGDIWTLFGEGIERIRLLRIRSRWGEVIFEGKDFPANSQQSSEGWDGTFNGVPMPAGAYTYEADLLLKGEKSERFVGSLTLIR